MSQVERTQPHPDAVDVDAHGRNDAEDSDGDDAADVMTYRDTAKFKTYRKHVRELYQSVATWESLWPAKSAQFLPFHRDLTAAGTAVPQSDDHQPAPAGCIEQTLLVGTSTGGQEQNFVKLLSLVQPRDHAAEFFNATYDEELRELGAFGMAPSACRMKIDLLMAHDGDVRKARAMPHNPNVIATSSTTEHVYIFDRGTVMRTAPPNQPARPLLPLLPPKPDANAPAEQRKRHAEKREVHRKALAQQERWDKERHAPQHRIALATGLTNSWALDWSPVAAGRVCCGGEEGLATWDLGGLRRGANTAEIPPTARCTAADGVNDAKWSLQDESLVLLGCGTIERAGSVALWDVRQAGDAPLAARFDPQVGVVNSVDWRPTSDGQTIAVGGADGCATVFDLRHTASPLQRVQAHAAHSEVTVSWCPHDASYLATGGSDGNAAVLHMGASQVLFVHTGHQDAVVDLAWSPNAALAGQLVSVDDSAVCAWKPRNEFFVPRK